jgi:hypothetical protein
LPGFGGIDAEIGAQFHRASDTPGYKHEAAI